MSLLERLLVRARQESGKKFNGIPERWMDTPHWRCSNDHVSLRYLKSESTGCDLCLACGERVFMTFPEDSEGPLGDPRQVAVGVTYPQRGDLVRVRLDPGGDWYEGSLIPADSLHFTVNQSPFRLWRYGDWGETWIVLPKPMKDVRSVGNPIWDWRGVEGSPYKPGDLVTVAAAIEREVHDVSHLLGRQGWVAYLEYDCGCGQSRPEDPMVGVAFAGDDAFLEEFWKEELRLDGRGIWRRSP